MIWSLTFTILEFEQKMSKQTGAQVPVFIYVVPFHEEMLEEHLAFSSIKDP